MAAGATSRKRTRSTEQELQLSSAFCLDELNSDLLERVLSWLPPSSFFRLRSVCRRWSSVASSEAFRAACSRIPRRDPWFLAVGIDPLYQRIVTLFDGGRSAVVPDLTSLRRHAGPIVPVASAGGLVCFCATSGELIVCNPLTGASRELPPPADGGADIRAIAMSSSPPGGGDKQSSYRIVVVSAGESSKLVAKTFDSTKGSWDEEVPLAQVTESSPGTEEALAGDESEPLYFLSKAGEVVVVVAAAAEMQRSPSKQYSSVLVANGGRGEEMVYFLGRSGEVVACDIGAGTVAEYPSLLPPCSEYSVDVAELMGEMVVVVLSELLDTASLRVWRFSEGQWRQVAAMPPAMSHELFGKKADVNCSGFGRSSMVVCISSSEYSGWFLFDAINDRWVELPERRRRPHRHGSGGRTEEDDEELVCAFPFEPRLEVSV